MSSFGLETVFDEVRRHLPQYIECSVVECPFTSRGVWRRALNMIHASTHQADVNHITGDVHYLSYLLQKRRTLLTIADSVFELRPWLQRSLVRLFWYRVPISRVQLVSVISHSAKKQLLAQVPCAPDRIRVIPACISTRFVPRPKPFNAERPTILHIGTTPNKNLERLVEALQGIRCRLVVVGSLSPSQSEALSRSGVPHVNRVSLTEDEIISEYAACDMVAFTSTYEGFGLPIVEANSIERPVVTSNILSMPEVAGDSACLVDPYDVRDIRDGILKVIHDGDYREDLVNKGRANRRRYDPATIAGQYAELYEELAGR